VVAAEVAAAVGIVIDLTKSYGIIITIDYLLRLLPVNDLFTFTRNYCFVIQTLR
jgi:hypothetical protein